MHMCVGGATQIHLFGASLGGYLALHYTVAHMDRVESLCLCNAFADTRPFHQSSNCVKMFSYAPEFYLKKYILESFPDETEHPEAVDFIVDLLEGLNRQDLGARLTLNCTKYELGDTSKLDQSKLTLLHSNDDVVLPGGMRARLLERFPHAREALLKEGGDFPYLASPDEVNLMIQVHLRSNGLFPDISGGKRNSSSSSSSDTKDTLSSSTTSSSLSSISSATSSAAGSGASTVFLKLSHPGGGGSQVLPEDPEALRLMAPRIEITTSSSSSSSPTSSISSATNVSSSVSSVSSTIGGSDTSSSKDDEEEEAAWIARVSARADEEQASSRAAAVAAAAAELAAKERAAHDAAANAASTIAAKRQQVLLAEMGVSEPSFD